MRGANGDRWGERRGRETRGNVNRGRATLKIVKIGNIGGSGGTDKKKR